MLRGLGHTDWEFTHEVLRLTIDVEKDGKYGLATSHREGGKIPRGMANQSDVEGWAISAATISPLRNTSILPISFQDANRSEEATRRYDETFLMKRPRTRAKLLLGDGFVGGYLSTYQTRGTGDLTCKKYEYGSSNEVEDQDNGPSGRPSYINIEG